MLTVKIKCVAVHSAVSSEYIQQRLGPHIDGALGILEVVSG